MQKILYIVPLLMTGVAYASPELDVAIENVRQNCGNISSELNHLKTMAGINTAVTAVGTVTGGVGLATGIAKSGVDSEIEQLEKEIEELKKSRGDVPIEHLEIEDEALFERQVAEFIASYQAKEAELSAAEKKSKTLGNVRTGMLATSTATNIAGAVIAANNRVDGDLQAKINACKMSVKELSNAQMQARATENATADELAHAGQIVHACGAWDMVDISSINKKSTGATVSSGVGAALGVAGTITSASANSNSVRNGDRDKEKNLNNAANVLAGGTTLASGAAVIFNATQIGAIKRAASAADECEGALK
ncbi:hypothetical protein HDR61_01965 [bacterium]|nr:hypothetical protein [bacterium]